jgi:DNA primase
MRYPQTFIDDLKRQTDIVRVIQDYVQLKKKGANWMACCPFHKEKTPSFSVSSAKEIFYCFGCHKGGSVFTFVMEMERVAFPEAVKIVAEKSGVPLPKLIDDSRFEAKRQESDEVIQLNRWALEWWEQQLDSNSSEARAAREYLIQREITNETRKTFRLGLAPDSWDALSFYLKQKGASQSQIERSGLVVKKEEGGYYDRFRGRLMFPVMDVQGRPIAFGGRTLKNEDAKYINSPETAAYIKGRNLFGLNLSRDEIRRQGYAILVEGFLDLIVPYQFGIRNVVASLGTALTLEQAKLLGRFARKVVVNYDGDRPGVQAAKKAIEILLAEDLEVKVLMLPDNADPDEFIRKQGTSEYQRRRGEAQPHLQFVIDQAVRDRKLTNPADKEAAIEDVLPFIRAVRSHIQKREYFDIAMDSLRVSDNTLKRQLWQTVRTRDVVQQDEPQLFKRKAANPTIAERRLLEFLLSAEEIRDSIIPRLETEYYAELVTGPIFTGVLELYNEGQSIDFEALSQKVADDPESTELLPMFFLGETLLDDDGKPLDGHTADSCLAELRVASLDRRIQALAFQMSEAERAGDAAERDRVALEQIELTRKRNTLMPRAEAAPPGF